MGPYVGGDVFLFKTLASPIVKQGLVLDFVPETGHKEGRIKWNNKHQKKVDDDVAVS